jgi:hypothetical protein
MFTLPNNVHFNRAISGTEPIQWCRASQSSSIALNPSHSY